MTHITTSTPGGKSTTHGPRRRGLPGGQSMHENLRRMNRESGEDLPGLHKACVLALAFIAGLALVNYMTFPPVGGADSVSAQEWGQ